MLLSAREDNIVNIEALIQDDRWGKLCELAVVLDLKLMVHEIINLYDGWILDICDQCLIHNNTKNDGLVWNISSPIWIHVY